MTMSQIIAQEEIERWDFLALHEEMSLREERLMHEETMICRNQQMDKESLLMCSPRRWRGKLDEGTEKGGFMTEMVKYLVYLEETAIRRDVTRTRLGLRGAVLGRGGAGMIKGGDAAAEIAAICFETHTSRVKVLEIEADAVQANIDAQ